MSNTNRTANLKIRETVTGDYVEITRFEDGSCHLYASMDLRLDKHKAEQIARFLNASFPELPVATHINL